MFKFTDDKINLFIQTYVHNNKNTNVINFIKLFFKKRFSNIEDLQKNKNLEKEKKKKLEKELKNLQQIIMIIILENLNKKNHIAKLKLNYIYKKLSKITILNKIETQKNIFENNLTLNNTILYL